MKIKNITIEFEDRADAMLVFEVPTTPELAIAEFERYLQDLDSPRPVLVNERIVLKPFSLS